MSSLVISARDQATSTFQLWRVTYPDGASRQITNGFGGVSRRQFGWSKYRNGTKLIVLGIDLLPVRRIISQVRSSIASGVGLSYGLTWAGNEKIVFSSMAQRQTQYFAYQRRWF